MINKYIGLLFHGEILERTSWEIQLFAPLRSFKDGITFFEFNINWDKYKSEHSPSFQIELTILNLYNHLWIYENNFDDELDD